MIYASVPELPRAASVVGIVMARGIKAHDEIASVSPFSSRVDRKSEVRISGLIKSVPIGDYTPHRETFAGATFNAVNIIVRLGQRRASK